MLALSLHGARAQQLQQWMDTLSLETSRLVLKLHSGHASLGTPGMSFDLHGVKCAGFRLGHGTGVDALQSRVVTADGLAGDESHDRLAIDIRQVDFRCTFDKIAVRRGWPTEPIRAGDDVASLVFPADKYDIVTTLAGAVAENVALSVSDLHCELELQLDVDDAGL